MNLLIIALICFVVALIGLVDVCIIASKAKMRMEDVKERIGRLNDGCAKEGKKEIR